MFEVSDTMLLYIHIRNMVLVTIAASTVRFCKRLSAVGAAAVNHSVTQTKGACAWHSTHRQHNEPLVGVRPPTSHNVGMLPKIEVSSPDSATTTLPKTVISELALVLASFCTTTDWKTYASNFPE